jgi:hypothetical protein
MVDEYRALMTLPLSTQKNESTGAARKFRFFEQVNPFSPLGEHHEYSILHFGPVILFYIWNFELRC